MLERDRMIIDALLSLKCLDSTTESYRISIVVPHAVLSFLEDNTKVHFNGSTTGERRISAVVP
jgi:hypothetical protein